jgi:hypothetical protein
VGIDLNLLAGALRFVPDDGVDCNVSWLGWGDAGALELDGEHWRIIVAEHRVAEVEGLPVLLEE